MPFFSAARGELRVCMCSVLQAWQAICPPSRVFIFLSFFRYASSAAAIRLALMHHHFHAAILPQWRPQRACTGCHTCLLLWSPLPWEPSPPPVRRRRHIDISLFFFIFDALLCHYFCHFHRCYYCHTLRCRFIFVSIIARSTIVRYSHAARFIDYYCY